MLPLTYLHDDPALARRALARWDHDTETLDEMLGWFRISSNAVYPFATDGATRLLRLSPCAEKDGDAIRAEIDYAEHLSARGAQVLRFVPSRDGELVVRVPSPGGDWWACVTERVPGESLDDLELTDARLVALGALLADLHAAQEDLVPPAARLDDASALAWARTVLATRAEGVGNLDAAAVAALVVECDDVAAELAALPREDGAVGVVHYDLEPDNVFADEVTGLWAIDLDDCMRTFLAVDVSQTLDAVADEVGPERAAAATAAVVAGYRARRPLPAHPTDVWVTLRRFSDLFSAARIAHALVPVGPDEPEWMAGLRLHLAELLDGYATRPARVARAERTAAVIDA